MTFDLNIIENSQLSENSIMSYVKKLKKLNKDFEKNNIKLRQHRRIFNFITRNYPNLNSQNAILSAWKKYLVLTGKDKLKIVKSISERIVKNIETRDREKKMNKGKKKSKIQDVNFNQGKNDFITDIKDKDKLNEDEFLLSLLILQPTRRNVFVEMIFINNINSNNNDDNYLFVNENDVKLILNSYKTIKSIGKMTIDIEDELLREIVINYTKDLKNNEPLFKHKPRYYQSKLRVITNKYFNQGLTIIDLRKLFLRPFKEQILDVYNRSLLMGHSIQTQINHYL